MCEFLDKLEEKGRAAGRLKAQIAAAQNLHEMGMDVSFIADVFEVSEDVVREWLGTQPA